MEEYWESVAIDLEQTSSHRAIYSFSQKNMWVEH